MGGKVVPPTWQSTHHRESWRHSPGALTACNHCGQLCAGIIRRKAGIPKGSTSAIRWPSGQAQKTLHPGRASSRAPGNGDFPFAKWGGSCRLLPFLPVMGEVPWGDNLEKVLMKEEDDGSADEGRLAKIKSFPCSDPPFPSFSECYQFLPTLSGTGVINGIFILSS